MDPDVAGKLALTVYAAAAALLVLRLLRRCPDGWQVWLLHVVARFYTPFVFRQRIAPECPLPRRSGALLIANHRSPVDPILIFSASPLKCEGHCVRRLEFLTAAEYCHLGGPLEFITRNMGSIPVARSGRDTAPVKEALRRLKAGHLVGVFPEGRINTGAGLLPGNPGIAWLALHAQVPVVPVFVHGSPLGTDMVRPFSTFSRVRVCFGTPVNLSAYSGRRINQELLQEVTERLMDELARLGGVERAPCTRRPEADRECPVET